MSAIDLELVGPGGEAVDFQRTIGSHGLAQLAPNAVSDDFRRLAVPLRLADGSLREVTLSPGAANTVRIAASGRALSAASSAALAARVRHMLALDDDFTAFYAIAERDPDLAWVRIGAGRFLRSPTVFEDVVKTICTTNCTWSATIRMTNALVCELGDPVPGRPQRRAFPSATAMAQADPRVYSEIARVGYRGPFLRRIAQAVDGGSLDLEALMQPALDDRAVESALLALPGVGPYAAAHIMLLLGRYGGLVLDSSTRPKYARLSGTRPRSDRPIRKRFARYGRFAGLAFWCYLTRDWIAESAASIDASTPASGSSARA